MGESDLGAYRRELTAAQDGITVVRALGDLPGGRTLEVEAYREALEAYARAHPGEAPMRAVYAGTPVGRTAAGAYMALPMGADGAFTLPAQVEPVGVVRASVPLDDPRAGIVTMGQVNWAAIPFRVPKALREAMPRLGFLHVKE